MNNLKFSIFFKTLSSLNASPLEYEEYLIDKKKKKKLKEDLKRKNINEKKYLKKFESQRVKNRLKDVVVYKLIFKVTRNNVFIIVLDPFGRHVFYSSGGLNYFFLRRRTVAVANILLGENLGIELRSKFINALDLEFHGLPFKSHRLNLIKGLTSSNIIIRDIIDKTPISHNGCDRKKKKRKKYKKRS